MYFKITYVLICICFINNRVGYSQNAVSNQPEKFSSFSVGTDFTSNNNINGRVSNFTNQPVLSTLASYYHKWGIDASVMFSNIWNSNETYSESSQEVSLSLAYDYDLTNWLNGSLSYNHYFYSKNSFAIQSNYQDLLSLNLYSEVDWWSTNAMVGYYSGKANELFLNFETGIDLTFDDIFKKGNILSVQAMISVYAGSIDFYNAEAFKNYYFLYKYSLRNPDATVSDVLALLESQGSNSNVENRLRDRLIAKYKLVKKVKQLPNDLVISTMFEEQHTFNFSSLGFELPVYYNWGDFMINIGLSAYKPLNQPSYFNSDWVLYTNAGITYFVSW